MTDRELRKLAELVANELRARFSIAGIVAMLDTNAPYINPPSWCGAGGFVYFIRVLDAVKIGHAASVQKRVHHIQCGSPIPVTLIGCYWSPDPKAEERRLHDRFRADRIRGEWYRLTDALQKEAAASLHKRSGPP